MLVPFLSETCIFRWIRKLSGSFAFRHRKLIFRTAVAQLPVGLIKVPGDAYQSENDDCIVISNAMLLVSCDCVSHLVFTIEAFVVVWDLWNRKRILIDFLL